MMDLFVEKPRSENHACKLFWQAIGAIKMLGGSCVYHHRSA